MHTHTPARTAHAHTCSLRRSTATINHQLELQEAEEAATPTPRKTAAATLGMLAQVFAADLLPTLLPKLNQMLIAQVCRCVGL